MDTDSWILKHFEKLKLAGSEFYRCMKEKLLESELDPMKKCIGSKFRSGTYEEMLWDPVPYPSKI